MIIANMQRSATLWLPRIAAFGVALLLAGSSVVWVLRMQRPAAEGVLPVVSSQAETPPVDLAAVSRVLGSAAPGPAPIAAEGSTRFRLTGIIASAGGQGVALLSVDGKPPKPYRRGTALEDGLVLQSVQARSVNLAADTTGPVRLRLELPPRQP